MNTNLSDKSLGVELPDPKVAPVVELLEPEKGELGLKGLLGLLLGLILGLPKLALNFSRPFGLKLLPTPRFGRGQDSKL